MALTGFQVRSGSTEIGFATIVAITIGGATASANATCAGHRVTETFAWVSIGIADAETLTRAIGRYAIGPFATSPDREMSSCPRQSAIVLLIGVLAFPAVVAVDQWWRFGAFAILAVLAVLAVTMMAVMTTGRPKWMAGGSEFIAAFACGP